MLRITSDLVAEAIAHGTLDTLADPVARELLEGATDVDQAIEAACEVPAVSLVLDDLIDLACAHGDTAMRATPGMAGWHTVGLSALIRSDSDHRLHTIADSKNLARAVADGLGLDYGSVRVGAYAMHSLSALATGPSDFAKTCATMRLEAAEALPPGIEPYYGLNEAGAKAIHLAQQVQLFISVKATSDMDARQMARELNQWATSRPRNLELTFNLVNGHPLQVGCLPLMAGLPWTLRRIAGYEIQALVLGELAESWARSAGSQAARHCATLIDFDESANVAAVTLVAWFEDAPETVLAARLGTAFAGELLDVKLTRKLTEAGWVCHDAEPNQDVLTGAFLLDGREVPLAWDPRFAP